MMNREEQIADAIAIVRDIEEEVKSRLFPAWDTADVYGHAATNARYRAAVDNAVRVYCAHQLIEVREVMVA